MKKGSAEKNRNNENPQTEIKKTFLGLDKENKAWYLNPKSLRCVVLIHPLLTNRTTIMTNFDFGSFNFFGNNSNNTSKKRADRQRRGRQCRIEELEGKEMLSVTPWSLMGDFGDTSLDSNVVEVAPVAQSQRVQYADLVFDPLTAAPVGYHAGDWARIEAITVANKTGAAALEAVLFATAWEDIGGELRLVDFAYDNGSNAFRVGGSLTGKVDLRGCEYLTRVFTYGSDQLTDLDVSGLTKLRHIAVRDCTGLQTLNVQGCTFLREIECWMTGLSELNLAGLSNLNRLDGGMGGIIATEMPNLTKVDISGTQISVLDWGNHNANVELIARNCVHLKELNLWGNNISKIDITGSTNITRFEIGGNSQLDQSKIIGFYDMKNSLQRFRIENSAFTGTLDLQGFKALTHLRADGTTVDKILIHGTRFLQFDQGGPFSDWGEWRLIRAFVDSTPQGTMLEGATFSAASTADLKVLQDNNLVGFATWEKVGTEWRVVGINGHDRLNGNLSDVPDGWQDGQHQYDDAENVNRKSLVPDGKLNVIGLSELRFLRVGVSNLFEVNVSGLTKLTHLDVSANRALTLAGLNTTGCIALEYLNIAECRSLAGVLNLTHLTGLVEIRMQDCNHLDGVDFTNLKNLKYVGGWWVGSDSQPRGTADGTFEWKVTGCDSLEVLFVPESPMGSINLTGLTNLKKFVAYTDTSYSDAARLTSITGLTTCTSLIHLELGRTKLTTLDLTDLAKLAELNLVRDIYLELNSLILTGTGTDIDTCFVPYDGPQNDFDGRFTINLSRDNFMRIDTVSWEGTTLTKNAGDLAKVKVLEDAGLDARYIAWAQVGTELRVVTIAAGGRGITEQLTEKNLDLSGMTALRQLNVEGLDLLSLNLSGCTALVQLYANQNWNMTSVNLTGCTNLVNARVSDNLLTALDLSAAKALWNLEIANTNISDLKLHAGAKTNLREVRMWGTDGGNTTAHGNRQPSIDGATFAGFTTLRLVEAQRTTTTSWDFTGCTGLEDLRLTRSAANELNLTGCVKLRELYINELVDGGGGLRTVDMTDLASLWRLDAWRAGLSYLRIDTINNNPAFDQLWIGNNPGLQAIYLNGPRPIDRGNLGANDTFVWLSYDELTPTYNANEEAKLREYGILPFAQWEQVENEYRVARIDASGSGLSGNANWNFTGFDYLERINLNNNSFNSVNITGAPNLEWLQVANNNLSSLNVSQFTKLVRLEFGSNNIQSIDIALLKDTLVALRCENNDLTELNLTGFTKLRELYAPNNRLGGVIDLSKSDISGTLNLEHNKLEGVIIAGKTGLTWVSLYDNLIETLDASGLTFLSWLNVGENGLKEINVTGNVRMDGMHLNTNMLTELDLSTNILLTSNVGFRFNNLKPSTIKLAEGVTYSFNADAFNNQTPFVVTAGGVDNKEIDLSDEYNATGATYFSWYNLETGVQLSVGTDYTENNGVFTFSAGFNGIVYAVITNTAFPTEFGREFRTTPVAVGTAELNYNENERDRLIASGIEVPEASKFVHWEYIAGVMRVTSIEIPLGSGLTTLDLTGFTELTKLIAGGAGTLESVTLSNNPLLAEVRLNGNALTFASLPTPQSPYDVVEGGEEAGQNYYFGGQARVSEGIPAELPPEGFVIDLSSTGATDFVWFLNNVELTPAQVTAMSTKVGSVFTFNGTGLAHESVLRCEMTNATFPGLTLQTVNIVVRSATPLTPVSFTASNVTADKASEDGDKIVFRVAAADMAGLMPLTYSYTDDAGNPQTGSFTMVGGALVSTVTGLTPDNAYTFTFTVVAADGYNLTSPGTFTISATPVKGEAPAPELVPPPNVTADQTAGKESTSATVAWDSVTPSVGGTVSYEFQYSTDGNAWITVSTNTTTAVIEGLSGGKEYRFRVRTIETVTGTNAGKYASEWSDVQAAQKVTTSAPGTTATVAKPKAKVDKKAATVNSVAINITKNQGVSYIVTGTYKVGKKDPQWTAANKGVLTATFSYTVDAAGKLVVTGLKPGVKYTFMVTAVDANGNAAEGKNIIKVAAATAKYTASKVKVVKKSATVDSFKFTTTPPKKAADVTAFGTFKTKIVVSYTVKVGKVKTVYEATLIDGVRTLKTNGNPVTEAAALAEHPFRNLSRTVEGTETTLTGLPAEKTKYSVAVSTIASGFDDTVGTVESLVGKATISTTK